MIRKIIEFCIRRPVTVTILLAVVGVLGFISFSSLKIALMPDMELPIAVVMTTYTGVGPEEIESNITKTVENAVKAVSDIDTVFSYSMSGQSIVAMQFEWNTNMDERMTDIRDRVSRIEKALPDDADKPMVMRMDINSLPVISVMLSSDTMSLNQIQQIAEDNIKPYLERISDLSDVTINGGVKREIHVSVDPVKLQNYGLSLNTISNTLRSENFNQSDGTIDEGGRKMYVRSMHEFETLDDINNVAISSSSGIIHLSDVAEVTDSTEELSSLVRVNGVSAVSISCQKASGANTAEACDEVKAAVASVLGDLNLDIAVNYVDDQSVQVNTSIATTGRELAEGALFAALVIFLFMKKIRSTLVICIAIPISIIATFVLMYFNGSTLNMITMGALSLGLGRMVDDSVVVYENIYRHKQLGKDAVTAAVDGASEVGGAVLATTTTICSCFVPILFANGLAAVLFKPMASTMICAMICSLIVSLTIVPLLASHLLKDLTIETVKEKAKFKRRGPVAFVLDAFGQGMDRLSVWYSNSLAKALKHCGVVILIVMVAFFGSFGLLPLIGMEFIPESDGGMISISVETDTGSTLEHTDRILNKMEELLQQIPEINVISVTLGGSSYTGGSSTNTANVSVELVHLAERERSVFDVAEEIRTMMSENVAGAKIEVGISSSMSIGSGGSSSGVEVNINGDDLDTLQKLGDQVIDIVKSVPGTREVSCNLSDGDPELQIQIDRQRAAIYGLNASGIANEVKASLQGLTSTKYRIEGSEYNIVVSYPQSEEKNIGYLEELVLHGAGGKTVPLIQLADMEINEGPQTIIRYDSVRRATVSCSLYGTDLGSASSAIQEKIDEMTLPSGYFIEIGGSNEYMTDSFVSLAYAMLLGLFLVYAVMAIQYESFFDPFIIMFSVPTSLIGALLGLFITGRSLGVTALIGVIMLIGIVVANAILLIDYTKQLRERGSTAYDALVEAGHTRLRPILMTALCTALAMLPIALALGEGAETQAPLATVVIGGLLASTFLTLFFVPALYLVCDRLRSRLMKPKDTLQA